MHNGKKAYNNLEFLNSRDARIVRILSEYLEPQARFKRHRIADTVVFFGSARAKPAEEAARALEQASAGDDADAIRRAELGVRLSGYYEDARELARRLTDWSKHLPSKKRRFIVCSGGGPGIMEAANRGASETAGLSIGLGISLPMEQSGNSWITHGLEFEFHYFFMRKFWFVYLAKALVVFPGGFGTFDELFELLTLVQTQKTAKTMPIVLYGRDYWQDVVRLDRLVEWGTISPGDVDLVHVSDDPDDAFDHLTGRLGELYLGEPTNNDDD